MYESRYRRTAAITRGAVWAVAIGAMGMAPVSAADYHVKREVTTAISPVISDLMHTESIVQEGTKAINRFRMHRLRRTSAPFRGIVILLPALGNNFRGYLTSEDGDPGRSFAGFLARTGYEVWGYSPRETGIASGQCGAALDCAEALDWGLATVVEDVGFIRNRIRSHYPGKMPVIGGLSLGAMSALAVVNAHPMQYAGLLAWDGSLTTANPLYQAHNQGFCAQFNGAIAAGVAVEDQSLPFVKAVAQAAQTAPNAPFAIPAPGFPPGLTNIQALVLILSTPNPVAPSPRPGFITAAGDVPSGQLFFSDPQRLTANIATFNDVTANRATRDLHCSLSGAETAFTNNLGNFRKPVMIIKAGQGMGSIMNELPGTLNSTAVTFWPMNGFGHVDHFGSPNHLALLEIPVSLWLAGVL